jgi:hypothetical protein
MFFLSSIIQGINPFSIQTNFVNRRFLVAQGKLELMLLEKLQLKTSKTIVLTKPSFGRLFMTSYLFIKYT